MAPFAGARGAVTRSFESLPATTETMVPQDRFLLAVPAMTAVRRTVERLAIAMVVAALGLGVAAQELRFVSIGTGSIGGTYFPIGGLIASAISSPPGSRPCEQGGSCGVPGLIAAAKSTQGSVENVLAVAEGALDTALSQADVAFFAYSGKGAFAGRPPLASLRAIANLFPEAIHVVVRWESAITDVAELRGKRVSLGEPESGTRVISRILLAAYGLDEKDVEARYEKVGVAGDLLVAGEIDAYVMVGGDPVHAIADAADRVDISLLPIRGTIADKIMADHPFLARATIPAGTYEGVDETPTLAVGALWVTSMAVDTDLVYGMTRALWHANNRALLDGGHPHARRMTVKSALDGVAIPLHPGAVRYYEEVGVTRAGVF